MTTPEPGQFGPPVPPPTPAQTPLQAPPQAPPTAPPSAGPQAYGQGAPYGYAPMAPPPVRRGNPGAAIAVGFGAMLAGGLLYGFIMKTTDSQWSYFALALALAVAFGLGKVGGRHPVLPLFGLLFSVLGVFIGQLFYIYLVVHQQYGLGFGEVFGSDFSDTMSGWHELMDAKDILFYGLAAFEGFVLTRRFGAAS
ncbi:hypothetical protein GCM10009665_31340 [Kitasatospora nipponensis]|uniref:DUF4199 domain-containing protein n=1 Tax=Kitasatospora nipponensis TaxID=258049 RepID=A0ABP4H0E4_9ACTN